MVNSVSLHTTIPVPKVLAWSADPSNPVGAEYIIMEKAPGIQLFKVWDDITKADRLSLIKGLTHLESQFAAMRFPAYGNLYFRHSILKASERIPLDSSVDPTGSFCVGPACGPAWTDGISPADIQPDIDAGPCKSHRRFACYVLIVTDDRANSFKIRIRTDTTVSCSDLSPPSCEHNPSTSRCGTSSRICTQRH